MRQNQRDDLLAIPEDVVLLLTNLDGRTAVLSCMSVIPPSYHVVLKFARRLGHDDREECVHRVTEPDKSNKGKRERPT